MLRLKNETFGVAQSQKLSEDLAAFKEQVMGLLKAQGSDAEEEYRRQSGLLLEGLRKVQAQLVSQAAALERIEKGVQRLFVSVDGGMRDIRQSLQANAEDLKALQELRACWDVELSRIEEYMRNKDPAGIPAAFDALKDYVDLLGDSLQESVRESMTREFGAMKEQLLQGDGRVLAELRAVQAQLAEVVVLGESTRSELAKGLMALQATVVNVNQRTCPTLFIISQPPERPAKKNIGSYVAAAIGKTKKLYAFATDSSARQDMIAEQLKDKLHLTLVCELCHQPQPEPEPYELTNPTEFAKKVLPLAKVGIKVVCGLNSISKIGRVFGLPSPVIPDGDLDKAREFVEAVGRSSLDDYKQLQERARLENGGGGEAAGAGAGSGLESERSMGEGYCAREFRHFLKKVDPLDQWGGLAAKVTQDGFVFFACQACCDKK